MIIDKKRERKKNMMISHILTVQPSRLSAGKSSVSQLGEGGKAIYLFRKKTQFLYLEDGAP